MAMKHSNAVTAQEGWPVGVMRVGWGEALTRIGDILAHAGLSHNECVIRPFRHFIVQCTNLGEVHAVPRCRPAAVAISTRTLLSAFSD